ncbi:response regulator transcription factor [Teichococcus oryzae]|uniref:Response regulatory domain-containing protein n=1 Tax=Teichococcus oryzae TaxID=1608942 RepID=A0A5B2THN0_9PROT|nr:hypothetical protein [Pseudoroseomonas oryzae]KAA2213689.1 hypothetical protein F0Q34_06355 [Pseudoroseomonas oryzae]
MTGAAEPGAESGAASGAEGARVLVVSADGAVRQALVLMLEAEGIPACSFASAAEFLGVREGPGADRCLLAEEKLPGPGGAALAATALAAGRARAAVILAPPARRAAPRPARAGIAFVDPFQLDEVLRAVRQALGSRTPCPACPAALAAMPQPCRP